MWKTQDFSFLNARAALTTSLHGTRLSRYARATTTRRDATTTDDDAAFFYFFKSRAHARFGERPRGRRVRFVSVRSINQSAARERVSDSFFSGTTDAGRARARSSRRDGRVRRNETEFVSFESRRFVRSFVDNRTGFGGFRSGRVDRSIEHRMDPRRRRGGARRETKRDLFIFTPWWTFKSVA